MAVTTIPLSHDGDFSDDEQHAQQHQQQHQQQPQPAPVTASAPAPSSFPPHALHQHTLSNASTATVDIEAWTVSALESLSISPIARGTGNALSIPLDHHDDATPLSSTPAALKLRNVAFNGAGSYGITPPRRPPSRRDSTKKREELQKGKEGTRQRRRWENGEPPSSQPSTNMRMC